MVVCRHSVDIDKITGFILRFEAKYNEDGFYNSVQTEAICSGFLLEHM